MNALKEILKWTTTLPAWQSDAVRRLLGQGSLSAQDQADVLAMAKVHHALLPADEKLTPKPLREEDLPKPSAAGAAPTVLVSMQDIKNANALAASQTLTFGPTGVTVVYGGNGTGKSGYARILKRACRARDAGGPILPDVLNAAKAAGPAEASITIAGAPTPLAWKDGQATPAALSEVSVLDGQCARLFIDQAAAVSYIPYGLDIFPKLGQLLGAFKDELDRETKTLQVRDSALDQLSGSHGVGKLIAGLSASTTAASVEALAVLSPAETERLASLELKKAELKANDPLKQAEALRRLKRRVEACRQKVESDSGALSAEVLGKLKSASVADFEAEQAAAQASTRQFQDEPLPGVGSATWKTMFKAAADYSATAYSGHPFPHVGDGTRCLLCQQLLQDDAKARLKRFWDFIEDRTAKDAQQAKAALDALVRTAKAHSFCAPDQELTREIAEHDKTLAALLETHSATAEAARQTLLKATADRNWTAATPLELKPSLDGLDALSTALEAKALEKESLAKPEETARLEFEFNELDARRRLSASKKVVLAEIARLDKLAKLAACSASLKTTDITKKGRELTDQMLTANLEAALKEELKKLRVQFELNFKPTAKEGQTKHQLQLPAAKTPKGVVLSDVLSEGEQHVIALAAFLAELRIAGGRNTIIFDDPVSSMDHNWADRTAKRLVEEGARRQVVVFTHNISFVVTLSQYAASLQTPLHVQWLKRVKNVPGHCTSELPWEVLSAKKRLKALTDLALEARSAYKDDPDGDAYKVLHGQFFDHLRATWERTVEELVLNEVVLRFRKGVETRRLRGVVLDDEDYKAIYDAMSLGSDETPAHDHASELLHGLKAPDDMDDEVRKLREFAKRLEAKQTEAEKRRDALTSPPKAVVAKAGEPTPA